jgi:hypothetical protein
MVPCRSINAIHAKRLDAGICYAQAYASKVKTSKTKYGTPARLPREILITVGDAKLEFGVKGTPIEVVVERLQTATVVSPELLVVVDPAEDVLS